MATSQLSGFPWPVEVPCGLFGKISFDRLFETIKSWRRMQNMPIFVEFHGTRREA